MTTTPQRSLEHGQICYLEIPVHEVAGSAEFYRQLFGWRTEVTYSSFEAPGMIGHWARDRPAAPDSGPMLWIFVDHIDATLEAVAANGGEVLSPPVAQGTRWLATFRDPGGNTIGVAQHGAR